MPDHRFGSIVGSEDTGGLLDATGCVLYREHTTLAIGLEDGKGPAVALELVGRINKSEETLSVVFFVSPADAGQIAGALADAVWRIGSDEARAVFEGGFAEAMS